MRSIALLIALPIALAAADAGDLQARINAAVQSGIPALVIPPGIYRSAATIELRGARNLVVQAEGATLVLTRASETALAITACSDVTVQGLAIDYDPLPFTQGRVAAVDPEARWAEFALDDGYPDLDADYAVKRLHLFTEDGRWKPGAPDVYGERTDILSPRRGRIAFPVAQPAVAAGDRVALNIRADYGIAVRSCPGDVTLRGVRIHAAPGLAVMQRFCRGRLRLEQVVVERGPLPAGASASRLLSSCADGVNVAYGRQGPEMTGGDLSFMGDDGLNIHGVTLPVVLVDSPTSAVVARPYAGEAYDQVCDAGDPVRILAPGDFAIRAEAPLAAIARLAANPGVDAAQLQRLHYRKTAAPVFWRLTLAAPAPLTVGGWIDLPAIASPGWRIADSHFHDHRGRGLRVMSSHGLVEGNRFARIKQAAISIGAEYGHWREAGWLEDVTVRGNRIADVFTGSMPASANYAPGAIAVFARLDRDGGPYPTGIRGIAITGNDIRGCNAAGILAYAAAGLTVEGNSIVDAAGVPADAAAHHGLPTGVVAIASPTP